jgi:hypothetical protein
VGFNLAVVKPGYMLEHPSIRRYSFTLSHPLRRVSTWAVKIRPVRTISRKPSGRCSTSTLVWVEFERLVRLAYGMNFAGKQRSRSIDEILTGSSETARQAPIQLTPLL